MNGLPLETGKKLQAFIMLHNPESNAWSKREIYDSKKTPLYITASKECEKHEERQVFSYATSINAVDRHIIHHLILEVCGVDFAMRIPS